jgi:acyl carrier protein
MNKDEVIAELAKIFYQITPEIEFKKINPTIPLRDQVEIDSLDFYRILAEVKKNLNVFVPDSKFRDLKSLDDLASFISGQPNHHL